MYTIKLGRFSAWSQVGECICGVHTDGVPAMLGCGSGFKQRVKLMSSRMIGVHCMIHRQVLASKTLPPHLNMILKVVVRAVNYIKTNALYTRLFAKLCQEMDSNHEVLLMNTEVRWLSREESYGTSLELKNELNIFFKNQGKIQLAELSNDEKELAKMAYLVDIFSLLNTLNLSLQGVNATVLEFQEKITSFRMKIDNWLTRIERNNLYMFPTLNAFLQE